MRKWYILVVILLLCIVGYNYIYKDHRDIASEPVNFVVTSSSINKAFSQSPTISEKKYLNKTIEVSGVISELNKNDLTLDEHVFCAFDYSINTTLKVHSKIKIKGRVIGYDDLLEQVKLDQCSIIN